MRRRMRTRRQTPETIQWPNRRRVAPFIVIGSSILLLLVTFKMVPKADNTYPIAPDGLGGYKQQATYNNPQSPEEMIARHRPAPPKKHEVEDDDDFARVRFDGPRNHHTGAKRSVNAEDEEAAHRGILKSKPEIIVDVGKRSKPEKTEKSLNDLSNAQNQSKSGTILLSKLISSTQQVKEEVEGQTGEISTVKPLALQPKIIPAKAHGDLYRERKIKRAKAMAALRRKKS